MNARSAPNYGGRVPVDTVPGPVPVYRAIKKLNPSAHHHDDELAHVDTPRKRRVLNRCNCGSTTMFSTTAPVELAPPAQQGHRSPCPRATAESPWSTRPWGSASASRQGSQPARPAQQGPRPPCTATLSHDGKGNSHDLQNRRIDHLVNVQLRNLDGPTNSLDHVISQSATTRIDEEPENVLLVKTGHDAEHHGACQSGKRHIATCKVPAKPVLYMPLPETMGGKVILVHTMMRSIWACREHKEHNARCTQTAIPALHMPLSKKKTASRHITVLLVHTSHDASILGLQTPEGNIT